MAKYIKMETALKVVEKYGLTNGSALGRHTGLAICIASEIAEIPAADVAPVVHARWVTHYRSGTPVAEGYVSTCCDMWNNRKSDYCPNCGAKMDGGDSNEVD